MHFFVGIFTTPVVRMHPLDLALVAVYLIGITLFGLRFRPRGRHARSPESRTLQSYFLADHSIPWWAIALSIVSAETSTLTIISVPGIAFTGDFAFLQIVLGYLLGRIVVAMIFLPRYFQGQMLTAYQLIDRRFGPTLHKVTAGLFLVTRAAAEGVRVFAISIVVGIAIGTPDTLSIAIISALTLLYTFEGGMAAVIWTDVLQMILYIAGTIVAVITLGARISGGWPHIATIASAAGKFHLFNFALNLSDSYTFWAGVLGGTFLTMASHGTDQLMVQRMLAARDLRESRLALLTSGLVVFLQFALFLLIGAGLYVFYGQHDALSISPDRIFPTFIVREMPTGVAGLLIAAILAAAMSNLSAALNSLSSSSVVDFYMTARPLADDRERLLVSRSSTVLWAFVLFAIAFFSIQTGGKGHVVETGLSIASVAYGALLGVFLLGTLTRYATQAGATVGMITGFTLNLFLWLHPAPLRVGVLSIPHVAFTWYVLIGSLVTFAVGSAASFFPPRGGRSRKGALVLALLIAVSATSVHGQRTVTTVPSPTGAKFSAISNAIEAAISTKKLPGAVVVIGHDRKIVFKQACGSRALEPVIEPMTEDTLFDVASLSKVLVTAPAVMQLYEQHRIGLDQPVAKYLPAFAVNGKEEVTVRELLTHYSGLPPDVDLMDSWGLETPSKQEGIRRALASSLKTKPGTHFEYSDINFIVLGVLVETISGEPLDVYAEKHIFAPLGLKHTCYTPAQKACGSLPISSEDLIPGPSQVIAPTAYDDEGTPATNPNFNHLLRGTVHDPTTRRMGGVAGHAGVFSTAADISIYAQALLDRLLRNAGDFPLGQAALQLMTTPQQPATALSGATIFIENGQTSKGIALRGLGWDINSAFSRPRGEIFPLSSFGHTGFSGTSIWIDPASDTYVILLANSIHPHVGASISPLRGQVATEAARALGIDLRQTAQFADTKSATDPSRVSGNDTTSNAFHLTALTGLDHLEATHFAALTAVAARHLHRLRLGLLTNQTGVDAMGRRTIDILGQDASAVVPGLSLDVLFSPEHGIMGTLDSVTIAKSSDPASHLPVTSLYGPKDRDRRPSHDELKNLDAVVIDLQDAGVRFYTYESVVGYFLEAAAQENASGHPLEIIVLDRPNPLGGEEVQGPVSDAGRESYTDYMPLPVRHGLTLGELARYMNGERHLPSAVSPNVQVPLAAPLTVVPMLYWNRNEYFDQTGIRWTGPSPNLRSLAAATLYPGVALLEMANVSVGRGTPRPFEHIGAPFIDGTRLREYLTGRHIPGVVFAAARFSVQDDNNHYPFHGQTIDGVEISVTDREVLNSPELGLELISALHHLYPKQFELSRTARLIVNNDTMQSLDQGDDPREIAKSWRSDLQSFEERRRPYLLYP